MGGLIGISKFYFCVFCLHSALALAASVEVAVECTAVSVEGAVVGMAVNVEGKGTICICTCIYSTCNSMP